MNTTSKQNLKSPVEAPEPSPRIFMWIGSLILLIVLAGLGLLAVGLSLIYVVALIIYDIERSPRFYVWLSVLAAMSLLAGYSLLASLVTSMEILEFSIRIPWATVVSAYAWLVVAGSGLCIINSLGAVFGMQRYEMMAKRIIFLSLTSIMFGLTYILLHLGHPERALIYNMISPNFRSAIAWMGALYNIYLIIVTVEFWLLIRPDLTERAERTDGLERTFFNLVTLKKLDDWRLGALLKDPRLPRIVGALAFVTGVSALTMLGSVFAHSESRVLWYGPYYPIYFLLSAVFCGYALLLAATIITYRARGDEMSPEMKALIFEMAQVMALVLVAGLVLTAYRLSTGLYDPASQGPVMLVLKGPFWPAFWIFEIGLMSVLPVLLVFWAARKKSLWGVLLASLMVLIGAFVMRYNFVVAGQIYPNIKEGLPSYFPTFMEVLLIAGIFGAFLIAYTLGEKFLPLKEKWPHHTS